MLRTLRRVSMTYVAYVLLLLAFVALGTFVYALATDSALAGIVGGSLIVLMVASVVGFRIGARNRAKSNDSGIEIEGANIWAQPLRREQIDRYLRSYRGARDGHEQKVQAVSAIAAEPTRLIDRRAALTAAAHHHSVPAFRAGPLLVADAVAGEMVPGLDVRRGGQPMDGSHGATGIALRALRMACEPQVEEILLADRMEMAHSVEGRMPLLDHQVAEAAVQVPVSMKVRGIRGKHVLLEAAKDVLIPDGYDARSIRSPRCPPVTRTTLCSSFSGTCSRRRPRWPGPQDF